MCVYPCMCVCVCIRVCVCLDVKALMLACAAGHVPVCVHLCVSVSKRLCVACNQVCVYLCVCVCMCVCVAALMLACAAGHVSVARILLEVGADPRRRDALGGTAALGAAKAGHDAILTLLKERNAE